MLFDMEKSLANLPADLVIDHMGSLRPERAIRQPGFQSLLRLVRSGRWLLGQAVEQLSHVSRTRSLLGHGALRTGFACREA